MSFFGSIMGKIFGSSNATPAAAVGPDAAAAPAADAAAAGGAAVDVEAALDGMDGSGNLNWRTSIVDLMKLCGLDSSLAARKELASELDFSGDTNDSASMNIWLHKQVMAKLAENGGKVPDSLKA